MTFRGPDGLSEPERSACRRVADGEAWLATARAVLHGELGWDATPADLARLEDLREAERRPRTCATALCSLWRER